MGARVPPYPWERGERLAEIRRKEAEAGLKQAGIRKWFFLSYPDGELIEHLESGFLELKRVVLNFSSDAVFSAGSPYSKTTSHTNVGTLERTETWRRNVYRGTYAIETEA